MKELVGVFCPISSIAFFCLPLDALLCCMLDHAPGVIGQLLGTLEMDTAWYDDDTTLRNCTQVGKLIPFLFFSVLHHPNRCALVPVHAESINVSLKDPADSKGMSHHPER